VKENLGCREIRSHLAKARQNFPKKSRPDKLKLTVFVQLRSEKFCNLHPKAVKLICILFSRAAKYSGMRQQKQLSCPASRAGNLPTQIDCILFSRRSENFRNKPTKATQIDCICLAVQRKILELPRKQSN
jgi:hypothetical protein